MGTELGTLSPTGSLRRHVADFQGEHVVLDDTVGFHGHEHRKGLALQSGSCGEIWENRAVAPPRSHPAHKAHVLRRRDHLVNVGTWRNNRWWQRCPLVCKFPPAMNHLHRFPIRINKGELVPVYF